MNNPIDRYECMKFSLKIITAEIIQQYKQWDLAHKGFMYMDIPKGVYGLPEVGKIANNKLKLHLAKLRYEPAPIMSGLWRHQTRPLQFSLVVDDFGVKYERQSDITYLPDALNTIYKISVDWDGKI